MFRFADVAMFNYLSLVPVVLVLTFFLVRRGHSKITKAFGEKLTPFLTASLSQSKRRWKIFLESIVLALFVVALARPQMGQKVQEVTSQGIEIMLLVDVSQSMMAEDVRPNRLTHAKKELSQLLKRFSGDKVGIIAFAGSSVVLSPLTTDKSSLQMFLESLSTTSVSTQGTVFRKALEQAQSAFEEGGAEKEETSRVTRAILIASDGEDNEPGAIKVAEELAASGVRIFSLAFGTEKGAPIPQRGQNGYLAGYKKDRSGKVVLSQVKGEALKKLAQVGKGSFYHATFGGQQIESISNDIDRLEKAEFDSQVVTDYDEKYQWILFAAILLALIELFLGERRLGRKFWRGRFEVAEQ